MLLISAFQVARITDMRHLYPAGWMLLEGKVKFKKIFTTLEFVLNSFLGIKEKPNLY
jgi:hypothetical protein